MPKTYFIKTYGCQANIADSNTLAGVLDALDFEPIIEPQLQNEDAVLHAILPETDVLIINTCSIRQKSEDKVYGMGKSLKRVHDETGKKPFVILAGCMVGSATSERQRIALKDLKKQTPWADAYINPSQIFTVPDILHKAGLLSDWAVQKFDPQKVQARLDTPVHAFINISNGCDNFCSFCVVPYARGREVSRSESDILKEIEHLVARGIKEVTLCGQNVNSWNLSMTEKLNTRSGSDQKLPFADLLRKVNTIDGITKIDFLSSNPFDFTSDLIDAVQLPKVSNYLHIAIQSGNNEVLKRMNRRYTVEEFIELIDRIKKVKPSAEIGTDIIVGFPGETREQFMDTVKLFQRIKFNVAFISIFSRRKGTPAAELFEDDVPRAEKKWRHAYLTKVWKATLV